MTTEELVREIATRLKENIPVKEINDYAITGGFTPEQVSAAFEAAHIKIQEDANRDPTIRLVLGPALLFISFIGFYTDWAGRSVGFGSVFGIVALLLGGRMTISLIKLWVYQRKK